MEDLIREVQKKLLEEIKKEESTFKRAMLISDYSVFMLSNK
jgi:hypothetical protein